MPSKKKKYNSRFPPARIKKIMQTDEEIGKVAAAVPVLISKCLEMFLASLLTKAGDVTKSKRAKTMSRTHLKQCIMTETMFDFLKDHVADIPDVQNDEEQPCGSSSFPPEKDPVKNVIRKRSLPKARKTPKKRVKLGHPSNNDNESEEETDSADDASGEGSGPEGSDAMLSSSFSSPGLISPSVQRRVEAQSSVTKGGGDKGGETTHQEQKSSFHIPLDALLNNDKIPASVEIQKPLEIVTADEARSPPLQIDLKDDSKQMKEGGEPRLLKDPTVQTPDYAIHKDKGSFEPHVGALSPQNNSSPMRQGVIVANTVAYPTASPYVMTTTAPSVQVTPGAGTTLGSSSLAKVPPMDPQPPKCASDGEKPHTMGHSPNAQHNSENHNNVLKTRSLPFPKTEKPHERQFARKAASIDAGKQELPPLPPVVPQPGSMLSFLYSTTSMPISPINMQPTVPRPQSHSPQPHYSYSPLTQHENQLAASVAQPQPPLHVYHNSAPPTSDGAYHTPNSIPHPASTHNPQPNFGLPVPHYRYPYGPFNPNHSLNPAYSSQTHFLGYPQTILTPPGHPVPSLNPQLAAHASLSMAKPQPKSKIDDADDYDA